MPVKEMQRIDRMMLRLAVIVIFGFGLVVSCMPAEAGAAQLSIEPGAINPWLSLIVSFFAVAGLLWSHLTSGSTKALKEVASLRAQVDANQSKIDESLKLLGEAITGRFQQMEGRVMLVEGEMKHLPDVKDITDMKLSISEMRGSMNVQAEVMSSVARTVQRLEGYLLERGK